MHDEDIPHIDDEEEDYDDKSRYDTPDTSRIEETSFTEQPAVRLKPGAEAETAAFSYRRPLYRHLEVDPGNIDLLDTSLFKVENTRGLLMTKISCQKISRY